MTRWLFLPAFVLAAIPVALVWGLAGRPVAIPDGAGAAIPCVSYTPFRGGQTPFDESLVVAPAQIEDDLRVLAAHQIRCVRTYSVDQGLERVPDIAARHGMAVLLGVWIGREEAKNRLQLETAVRLANAYSGTVRAVIVGNEVLLRRERTADDLARDLAWMRARTSVPLTYADVWEFWLRHPKLADAVDFVTVHVLPYWEDEPVANAGAARYVVETWRKMREAFPGRDVFLGETGWPSAGRMREGARPGRIEQARFLRDFSRLAANEPGLDYNLIEAFDQPWKRAAEGTVGGHWGLFDETRSGKFPWTGPVAPAPDWPADLAATEILAFALFILAFARNLSFGRWLALGILAQAAAAALVVQADFVLVSSRNVLEWAIGALGLALGFAVAALAAFGLAHGFGAAARIPPVAAALAWLARPRIETLGLPLALGLARFAFLAAALAQTLALLFDGRYRGFPVAGFIVPAAVFAGLAWLGGRTSGPDSQGRALALVLAAGGIAVTVLEGPANHQAIAWTLTALLLASPWLRHGRAP
jgi:glucan 1,3-beta-glucosidase